MASPEPPQDLEEEFLELARSHGASLRRVARLYEAAPRPREELEQEILLALWQALPQFRGEASHRTWLLRIAHNVGIRHATRSRSRPEEHLDHDPPARSRDSEEVLDQHRRRERLYAALRQLSPVDRQLVSLHLEGFSSPEISTLMGITATNVTTRLSRLRARLLDLLEDK